MDYQSAGKAARYKTNSLYKGRSHNAIYFRTVCHGGVFVRTVRCAAPPTTGNLAVACTTRKFAIRRLSDSKLRDLFRRNYSEKNVYPTNIIKKIISVTAYYIITMYTDIKKLYI
jgi:hypothetical protein